MIATRMISNYGIYRLLQLLHTAIETNNDKAASDILTVIENNTELFPRRNPNLNMEKYYITYGPGLSPNQDGLDYVTRSTDLPVDVSPSRNPLEMKIIHHFKFEDIWYILMESSDFILEKYPENKFITGKGILGVARNQHDDVIAIKLGFLKTRASFVFILSDEYYTNKKSIIFLPEYTNITIPKIEISTSQSLDDYVRKLGLSSILEAGLNFSNMFYGLEECENAKTAQNVDLNLDEIGVKADVRTEYCISGYMESSAEDNTNHIIIDNTKFDFQLLSQDIVILEGTLKHAPKGAANNLQPL